MSERRFKETVAYKFHTCDGCGEQIRPSIMNDAVGGTIDVPDADVTYMDGTYFDHDTGKVVKERYHKGKCFEDR